MRRLLVSLGVAALAAALTGPGLAQTISGTAFEDRDADGVRDADEPVIEGLPVELYGTSDGTGSVDTSMTTDLSGRFSFDPGDGCYLVTPRDPAGWRMSQARFDRFVQGTPGYSDPEGTPRFGRLDRVPATLRSGGLRYTAMGDSIAWNWNSCFYRETFWYSRRLRDRLECVGGGAPVALDEAAVKGEHTDDLLVDDTANLNNVFRVIEAQPDLVSISMIGNDLLGVDAGDDPTQTETNRAVEEVYDGLRNLQEAISWILTEVPEADVSLNTLYDNLTHACYAGTSTTEFHRDWLPIIGHHLRELAWGQLRRVTVNEVAAELAIEDLANICTGFDGKICRDFLQTDNIHPNNAGYEIILEKLWEGAGGVSLGPRDVADRSSASDVDFGYLRRVRRLYPTTFTVEGGATVETPEAALDAADGGSAARVALGGPDEDRAFRLDGFPDWYDEIRIVKRVAGVRYRTTGALSDWQYRIEASPSGVFRAPVGHAYTPTDHNFYTPLVGGGGPNQPDSNADYPDAVLLVRPEVAAYRDVSATVTDDPVVEGGRYRWPNPTHEDVATTAIRVSGAPGTGASPNPDFRVEIDAAWLDLYGYEVARPAEVEGLRARHLEDGSLEVSFDALEGATRYNVYLGSLDELRSGRYDHGGAAAPPDCDATTVDVGGGRLAVTLPPESQPSGPAYLLVTAHVDDVEAPSGFRTSGVERDRSQSTCR